MKPEMWVEAKGHPKYEVSSFGRVRRKSTGRLYKQSVNKKDGYLRVGMDGGHQYVHKLVLDSFGDNPNWGFRDGARRMYIRHKDKNRLNNNLDNLEFIGQN